MDTSRTRDIFGFTFLYAQLVASCWIVPEWPLSHLGEPVYLATLASIATTISITVIRASGRHGSAAERGLLALFLGGMPFVYLSSWALTPQSGWLAIELIGV